MLSGNTARPEKMPHEYFSGMPVESLSRRKLGKAVTFALSGLFGELHPIEYVRAGRTQKSPEEKSPGLRDPNRIQTYNLLIRSQMLYSIELWDQFKSNDLYFDSAYFVAPSSLRITIFFSLILAFFPESALR